MTTDAVGGVWSYAITLGNALAKTGVSISLVCLGPRPSQEQRQQALAIPKLRLLECSEPLEWMDDPWHGVERAGEYLQNVVQELQPDLVHLNGYCHAALEFGCPKLVVSHSCVLSWWQAVKGETAPPRYDRYRAAVAEGIRNADLVVAPTATMLRSLSRNYGLTSGWVIPNGLDQEHPSEPTKERVVLCAGRLWDEAKNIQVLARAAVGMAAPVYVAGAAPEAIPSVNLLGALGPQAMRQWFDRAAIYASPALYEPFGLAPLEAARSGAALVLGDIDSLREVWGDAALYIEPRNADALRSACNLLLKEPVLRDEMANRAMLRARRYSSSRQARLYAGLYRRLIEHYAAKESGRVYRQVAHV